MADNVKILSAFVEEDAAKLSGVSVGQLRAWRRDGFFRPTTMDVGGLAYGRIYSFKDVAALRVLNALRNQSKCTMPHLREVAEKLSGLGNEKWLKTRLYVVNRKVVFVPEGSDRPESVVDGQLIITVVLSDVLENLELAVKKQNARDPETIGKISRSRHVKRNSFVIAGTRIPVSTVRAWIDGGYNSKRITSEYPDLTPEDVEAVKRFDEQHAA